MLDVVGSTLHSILGRNKDPHAALLHMLRRNATDGTQIDLQDKFKVSNNPTWTWRFPRPTLVGTEMVSDAFSFSRRSVSSAMIRLASTYGASLWARGSFSATDEVENDARALQGKTKDYQNFDYTTIGVRRWNDLNAFN